MADKEATVYIVDVGKSMGRCRHGREISDLEWAMRYVWDKVTTTVATGRKTATVGIIGLKTDETSNELQSDSDDSYAQISVFQNIGQILMPHLRKLQDLIKPSNTDVGDAISALVLAIHMINTYCKKLKYKRKVVLVTNGEGQMNCHGIDQIAKKLKEDSIELVILGVDFDDPEYGFKEEDKAPSKADNESRLSTLVEDSDGILGTLEQATAELDLPRVKVVRSMPSFKGQLRLGDSMHYESGVAIDVERYYRTYIAKPPSASTFAVRVDETVGQDGQSSTTVAADGDDSINQLTNVRSTREYQVDDPEAPRGKRDVERDELAKGYEYGRTAVYISGSDENITKLETEAALELIGFIPKDNYERYMHLSTANVIIGQKTNDLAILALSSFIHALFELECYAVARLVTKPGKTPILVLLAPSIEPNFECLLEVQLPFAEDIRSYRFPPLDRVFTVSGKSITEHRNLPSEDLVSAMGKYVDSMELTEKDEDGEDIEALTIEDCFSPLLHRLDQAVRWRAIHPTEPIPPLSDAIQKLSRQPEDLQDKSKKRLERLIEAADVKKVPPKTKGRKRNRETEKPLSGLNVDELLHGEKRTKISPNNAIPEFKQALDNTENIDDVADIVKQMGTLIENQIRHSLGDSNYDRVIEWLGVMKVELVAFEEPDLYNEVLRGLKDKILDETLGGDRREMWWLIRKNRVGLIDQNLSNKSEITEQESREFLVSR